MMAKVRLNTFQVRLNADMTCLDCEHFVEEEPYSSVSVHPYCRLYKQWITCLQAADGSGYKGSTLLPIRYAKCINAYTGPLQGLTKER